MRSLKRPSESENENDCDCEQDFRAAQRRKLWSALMAEKDSIAADLAADKNKAGVSKARGDDNDDTCAKWNDGHRCRKKCHKTHACAICGGPHRRIKCADHGAHHEYGQDTRHRRQSKPAPAHQTRLVNV